MKWLIILASAALAIYALDHRWREQRRWSRLPSNEPPGDPTLWFEGRVRPDYWLHKDGRVDYFGGV